MNYRENKTENKKNRTSVSGIIYAIRVPEKGKEQKNIIFISNQHFFSQMLRCLRDAIL